MSVGVSVPNNVGVEIGDVIGDKYKIEAVLGAGGMGVVFSARHIKLNGQFALKFLSREASSNEQAVGRFQREAQAAAMLRSEHAVRVFDVGTHTNGLPYIVMEYLEGGDLGRLLRSVGQLSISEAVDYLLQACAAIAEAHKVGIIHRDLKPSNLFCVTRDDGSLMIKVLDFGISKVNDTAVTDSGVTITGNFIGSPSYMSPEQMRAPNRVDARTDIWSLGVVLYECLAAKLPFPAGSFPEICLRVAEAPPLPIRDFLPDVPDELEAIISKCLQKNREQRYAKVTELAAALNQFKKNMAASAANAEPALSQREANALQALAKFNAPGRAGARGTSFNLTEPSWARTASSMTSRRRPIVLALSGTALVIVAGGLLWFGRSRLHADVSAVVSAPSASDGASMAPAANAASASPANEAELEASPGPGITPRSDVEAAPVPATSEDETEVKAPAATPSSEREEHATTPPPARERERDAKPAAATASTPPAPPVPAARTAPAVPVSKPAVIPVNRGAVAPRPASSAKPATERNPNSSIWRR